MLMSVDLANSGFGNLPLIGFRSVHHLRVLTSCSKGSHEKLHGSIYMRYTITWAYWEEMNDCSELVATWYAAGYWEQKRWDRNICTVDEMAHYDCTRLSLAQRKSGSAPQYNGTLAWSRKGNQMADYRMKCKDKKDKVKTKNKTHRIAVPLYSFMGSISRPFSSTFFSRSKVDRTDAAASVTIEWARCLAAQTLPGLWY